MSGPRRMATQVRWLLVPVVALLVWWAAMIVGLVGVVALDALCPDDLKVSDMCVAEWYGPAIDALGAMIAAATAAGMIVATTAVAPSHKLQVAIATYGCGAAFAVFVASGGGMRGPFAAAAAGGTAALAWWLRRRRTAPTLGGMMPTP